MGDCKASIGDQGFRVLRVQGIGFRVWGLGFRVWSLGFGVWGCF